MKFGSYRYQVRYEDDEGERVLGRARTRKKAEEMATVWAKVPEVKRAWVEDLRCTNPVHEPAAEATEQGG